VDGGYGVVIDRSECREEARNENNAAKVFVAPRRSRVKAQHGYGEIIVQDESACIEILLGGGAARIASLVPKPLSMRDALDVLVGAAIIIVGLCIDGAKVPFGNICRSDRTIVLAAIAGLSVGKTQPLANIVAAFAPVVAAVAVTQKPVRRRRAQPHR
jgi:hypothetical protein